MALTEYVRNGVIVTQTSPIGRAEDGTYVGEYVCTQTGRKLRLESKQKAAVSRGLRHFKGRWEGSLSHITAAGLELHEAPLDRLYDCYRIEAQDEMDMELRSKSGKKTARELLVRHLTPAQLDTFEEHEYFFVDVKPESRRGVIGWSEGQYKIAAQHSFNVTHVETKEAFCVVAAEPVPIYDQMLTQKLLLENEPEKFFAKANRSGPWSDNDWGSASFTCSVSMSTAFITRPIARR